MKNLVKSIAVAAAMVFATSVYADSYLYWMLEDTATGDFSGEWDYAKIKAVKTSPSYDPYAAGTYLCYGDDTGADAQKYEKNVGDDIYEMYSKVGSEYLNGDYGFVIELYDSENGWLGQSGVTAFNAANIVDSLNPASEATFGDFTAVPEPTGGLLALLGMAALALRRRQKLV